MPLISLYQYTTETGLVSILESKRIKISQPWSTNDITEGVADGETTQREELKKYGYICLSATCTSPAMWGYYAARSRGACLRFDFPCINPQAETLTYADHYMKCTRFLRKVKYSETKATGNDLHELLATKSTDWQHEKEYRALYELSKLSPNDIEYGSTTCTYYARDIMKYLTGIILGARSNIQTTDLHSIIQRKLRIPIDIYRVSSAGSAFEFQLKCCHREERDPCM